MTTIIMERQTVITKEEMENYCMGKWSVKASVNDDLESLFDDIQLGEEPDEQNWTYFLPKLTKEELDLVEKRDPSYLETVSHIPWVSNLIPKKTKKSELGKTFTAILFEIKNNPYTPIFSLVGVSVGEISEYNF